MIGSLLLLPYAALVRFLAFSGTFPGEIPTMGTFSHWLAGDVFQNGAVALVAGILLVYFHALVLNRVVIQHRMTNLFTLFPGMVYVLVVSYFPAYNGLSSPLIANTFVLIAIHRLYGTHKKSGNAARIFDAGFWLSVAGLTYFGYTPLFLFGIIGLSTLRTLKSREWVQYLIGYATPFVIFGMLDYIRGGNLAGLQLHFTGYWGFLDVELSSGSTHHLLMIFFGFLFIISLISFVSLKQRKGLHAQKKIDLLLWLLFLGLGVAVVKKDIGASDWLVLCIPLATFMAMLLARSKQHALMEIIHFVFLTGTLGLQVWVLLNA